MSLDILFEDAHLLVVNKPAGLLSVPGRAAHNKDSVQSRAEALYPQALTVHRLDCATSGVMVLAKTKAAHRELSRQFQDRETHKQYHALTYGPCEQEEGEMNFPLITDWPNRPKQKICYEQGTPSLTRFRLLKREGNINHLLLIPITGRSHQLRLHTMAMGMPIIGDTFYANQAIATMKDRLMLHAHRLDIRHPASAQALQFQAELPF